LDLTDDDFSQCAFDFPDGVRDGFEPVVHKGKSRRFASRRDGEDVVDLHENWFEPGFADHVHGAAGRDT
jgi:hypothetical protein